MQRAVRKDMRCLHRTTQVAMGPTGMMVICPHPPLVCYLENSPNEVWIVCGETNWTFLNFQAELSYEVKGPLHTGGYAVTVRPTEPAEPIEGLYTHYEYVYTP